MCTFKQWIIPAPFFFSRQLLLTYKKTNGAKAVKTHFLLKFFLGFFFRPGAFFGAKLGASANEFSDF